MKTRVATGLPAKPPKGNGNRTSIPRNTMFWTRVWCEWEKREGAADETEGRCAILARDVKTAGDRGTYETGHETGD